MIYLRSFFFLLLSFLPTLIHAADSDRPALDFTPPPDDLSIKLLGNIFGLVDGVLAGTGSQVLGEMFGVFNAAVLACGGILVMYITLVSTLNTAHEGEFLGRQWSSVWIPVRTVLGVALLLPKASGYCMMQIFVMWMVVQGVGAADRIWDAALDYLARGGVIVQKEIKVDRTENASDFKYMSDQASKLLQCEVCLTSLSDTLSEQRKRDIDNGLYEPNSPEDPGNVPSFTSNIDLIEAYRDSLGNDKNKVSVLFPNFDSGYYKYFNGACGGISFNKLTENEIEQLKENLNISPQQMKKVQETRAVAVQQMYYLLNSTAQNIVRNDLSVPKEDRLPYGEPGDGAGLNASLWISVLPNKPPLLNGTELTDASKSFFAFMLPTLRAMESNIREEVDFIPKAKREGWILAGSYFFKLAKVNRANRGIVTEKETVFVDPPSSLKTNSVIQALVESKRLEESLYEKLIAVNEIIDIDQDHSDPTLKSRTEFGRYLIQAQTFPPVQSKDKPFKYRIDIDIPPLSIEKLQELNCKGGSSLAAIIGGAICKFVINPIITFYINTMFITQATFWANTFMYPILEMIGQAIADFIIALAGSLMEKTEGLTEGYANPILVLMELGDQLVSIIGQIWLLSGVVTFMVSVIPFIGFGHMAFIMWFGPLLLMIMMFLFMSGMVMAYFLPIVPYLIFTFAVIGWFIAVIETMISAPVLSLALAHPKGEDILGMAETGLKLIISVFFRPSLLIIGFIVAIILSFVAIWLVNAGFATALGLKSLLGEAGGGAW